jgi:hypothetical protein
MEEELRREICSDTEHYLQAATPFSSNCPDTQLSSAMYMCYLVNKVLVQQPTAVGMELYIAQ